MSQDLVWYVAYGSNILYERFLVYINGGSFRGGRLYNGCTDKTPPKKDKPFTLPYERYFGNNSPTWSGKGVAFIDPNKKGTTPGRAYLITTAQFKEIQKQEGNSASWYGRIVEICCDEDGIPYQTFTSENRRDENKPSDDYLTVIGEGLKELEVKAKQLSAQSAKEAPLMNKPDKLPLRTPDLTERNYAALISLFPNAVTEAVDENGVVVRAIDADVLRQEINTHIVSGKEERYQFTWPDKKKAVLLANAPIAATLRPCRGESVDFDSTENLYIEGDNLDVLKLLRETYLNRVKMIYIDPPYNTGNDFIYEDDFAEDTIEFLARDYQFDENGNRMVRNLDSNGRFHTDWLNMMYPRLRVARDLLSEDGAIFVSIDDSEIRNLRHLLDDIFGEMNFVAQLIWRSRQNKDNRNISGASIDHEYILCYVKQFGHRIFRGTERKTGQYTNPDNDARGPWTSANMVGLATSDARPNLHYDLINPDTCINYGCPAKGWRYDKSTMQKLIIESRILWPEAPDGRPRKKAFLNELSDNLPGVSSIFGDDIYTNTATKELMNLFASHLFGFPKPSNLLKNLVSQITEKTDIVLDFFSGSATTAHAVMQLNAEDGGKRKFIMVQIPEVCDENSEAAKAGYKNICEIGKERIRRAGTKIKADNASKEGIENLDIGFRVLKLDSSNMKDVYYTPQDTVSAGGTFHINLDGLVDNIKPDRSAEDLLFQVMLDLGVLLSSKIEQREICGKTVFSVADNYLMACFDSVTDEIVAEIAKSKPYYAVFRDSSFAGDATLVNFEQIFKTYSPTTIRKVL